MPAQLNVLSAGAVSPGLIKIIEAFRHETGHAVQATFATAPELRKRLGNGEIADVVIAPPELLDELAKAGKAAAERVIVGRIGVGVMVRDGAPVPRVATVDEFKQALLNSQSIVFNQASTGLYIDSLFKRLGIAAEMEAKITRYADFAAVRDRIGKGQGSEIGFGATTVIIESGSKGVTFAGPVPAEIQNYTTYAAAAVERSNAKETARDLLRYLTGPTAKNLFKRAGIE
jgi:molybdate transport system substrate-binding protein